MKLMLTLICFFCPFQVVFGQSTGKTISKTSSNKHALTENKGQWDKNVLFQSRSQGQNFWIQQHGFLYDLRYYTYNNHNSDKLKSSPKEYVTDVVAANFIGSNEVKNIQKEIKSSYYYNYLIGNDSTRWAKKVHSYEEVTLPNFYSGVDLKVSDNSRGLKYEFHCAPGSAINAISYELKGAKSIEINRKGELVIDTKLGKIIEGKPRTYQLSNGDTIEIDCYFKLNGKTVQFGLGNYNKSLDLVIDPILVFATYSGSFSDNFGMTATYGYDGTAYSGGTVFGNGYPTPNGAAYDITSNFTVLNGAQGISDVVISKYAADGSTMLWSNFLGGGGNTQGTETVHSLICDKFNNLYAFGVTSSSNFPTKNAFQANHGGGSYLEVQYNGSNFGANGTDMYISKLSSDGTQLLGSTYMGGSANDGASYLISSGVYNSPALYDSLTTNYGDQFRGEIMVDSVGNCLIASCTRSTNFPTKNAFQPTKSGEQDGVVFQLSSNLSTLNWSSYFGGSKNDACYSVKIDSSYNIVFAGGTSSSNLPKTAGAWQSSYNGGKTDGFVAKLSPNGQTLVRTSYIGTVNYDQVFFAEINRNDDIFVLGQSDKGQFPVNNATSTTNNGQFIAKLKPDLTSVLNSFQFGNGDGTVNISPSAFLVDVCGNMYVSGWGANILQPNPLDDMPVSADAYQPNSGNGFDFYLGVFKRTFDGLLYGTYYGGANAEEHVDGGTSRFDRAGVVYQSVCGGCGGVDDGLATPGAWSETNNSNNCNNLVFKFDFQVIPQAEFEVSDQEFCGAQNVQFTNLSTGLDSYLWDFGNGDTTSTVFNPTRFFGTPGVYPVLLTILDSVCLLRDTFEITILIGPTLVLTTPNDSLLCQPALNYTINASSNKAATEYVWSSSPNFSDTLNVNSADSTFTMDILRDTIIYVKASNIGCFEIDTIRFRVVKPPEISVIPSDTSGCSPLTVQFNNSSANYDSYLWTFEDNTSSSTVVSPTRSFNTPGNYQVILHLDEGNCGFSDEDTFNIQVVPPVSLSVSNDSLLCAPATGIPLKSLTNGTGNTFIWSSNDVFSDTLNTVLSDSTFFVDILDDTVFYVKASNLDCAAIDTIHFVVENVPVIDVLPSSISGCAPLTVIFSNSSTDFDSYTWTFEDNSTSTTIPNPTRTFTLPGSYTVKLNLQESNCGLSAQDSFIIQVVPPVTIKAFKDTVLCVPSSLNLYANSFGTANSFVWSTNPNFSDTLNSNLSDSTITVNPTTNRIYYVKGMNGGCINVDTVTVTILSASINLNGPNGVCGKDLYQYKVTLPNTFGNYTVDWSPTPLTLNDSTNTAGMSFTSNQWIYATIQLANGCKIKDSLFVTVSKIGLEINAFATPYMVPAGETTVLTALPIGYSYEWFPKDGVASPFAQTTTATVNSPTIYTVKVRDLICEKSDTVFVNLFDLKCDEPYVFIPSGFSPNGDGENDELFVRSIIVDEFILRIFDRWGELVFESTSLHNGWDGTYKGTPLPPDVYDYYLEANCINDTKTFKKGNITLIR